MKQLISKEVGYVLAERLMLAIGRLMLCSRLTGQQPSAKLRSRHKEISRSIR
jgi:hypothetical protein